MILKRLIPVLLMLLGMPVLLPAQLGFYIMEGRKQVDIPFEYTNNFIILNIRFNGVLPLRFIFDTGAEHTILADKTFTDLLQLRYEHVFKVAGSDLNTPMTAYLVRKVRFDIPEKVYAPMEDILVLEEDYFRFEEYAGIEVHGILSANAFSRYIVKINYQRRVISLYAREVFKPGKDYSALPIEVFRNKLYIRTTLEMAPDSLAKVKLLIDTGAGLPLLLFSDTHPLLHPPANAIVSNIGMGLGGYLEGFTGRIRRLDLDPFVQQGVITYFQMLDTAVGNPAYLNDRNGLVGNGILSRFILVMDYQKGMIWLKPTARYRERFVFDRSGIAVIASGKDLNTYIVQSVIPGSPADEAGIRRGDEIAGIGFFSSNWLSLYSIQRKFMKKPGSRLRVTVIRDGVKIITSIVLRDLI